MLYNNIMLTYDTTSSDIDCNNKNDIDNINNDNNDKKD